MLGVAVDHGAGGEGEIIPFAIERLLDAAIVLLTLHIALPILHQDPLARLSGLEPVVAVIGIEMTLEVAKLRYQCGSPCQSIVVRDELVRRVAHHQEEVQVVLTMLQDDLILGFFAKVISPGAEGVGKDSIAGCTPVEWGGGGYTSVDPVIGILDSNRLTSVRETTVLHSAAIEILVLSHREEDCARCFLKYRCSHLPHDALVTPKVSYTHETCTLLGGDGDRIGVDHMITRPVCRRGDPKWSGAPRTTD